MEGRKDDAAKARFDLLTFAAIEEVAKVLTFGARKYADHNWKKVPNLRQRYLAAGLRHVWQWAKGVRNDRETGLHHLAHATCCFLFVLEAELVEQAPAWEPKLGDTVRITDERFFHGRIGVIDKIDQTESELPYRVTDGRWFRWFGRQEFELVSGAV